MVCCTGAWPLPAALGCTGLHYTAGAQISPNVGSDVWLAGDEQCVFTQPPDVLALPAGSLAKQAAHWWVRVGGWGRSNGWPDAQVSSGLAVAVAVAVIVRGCAPL